MKKTGSKSPASMTAPEPSELGRTEAEPTAWAAIRRILVPVDFSVCSLQALDYAVMLAGTFEATVILLHVVEPTGCSREYLSNPAEDEERRQAHLQSEHERLVALQRKRVGQRVAGETLVRLGRAWSEIPDTAKALGADLIVLGVHGLSPLNHFSLGSTAEGVLRHAHCPVLTVTQPAYARD